MNLRAQELSLREAEREHRDVVFLTKRLRRLCHPFCGLLADGRGAVKTEEFARCWVPGFKDSIRDQR